MKQTIFFLAVVLAGSMLINLFSVGKINEQKDVIEQKQAENERLKHDLSVQRAISYDLQKRNDSLVKAWQDSPKEKIIERIKIKNNEKYIHYLNSVLDEQIRIFAEWIEQERADYNHWQRHANSDNN